MKIQLTRGDTERYKFQCKDSAGEVILTIADKMFFTVKKTSDSIAVIKKKLSDMTFDAEGFYHFTIEAADTERLEAGTYVYDIEVTRGTVVTTISKGQVQIQSDVTTPEDKR